MTIHRNDYGTFITYYNKRHPLKVKKKKKVFNTVKHRFSGKGFSPDFSKKFKNNPKIRYPRHEKPIPPFAFYKLHIFVISFVNFVKLRINLNFILVKMDIEEEIIKKRYIGYHRSGSANPKTQDPVKRCFTVYDEISL